MPTNLPKRPSGTTQQISQKCLPGGPRSATYDATTYTYKAENSGVSATSLLEPSIIAIEGDTQVGGYLYNSASGDANFNRGKYPQPHTITEKSFYTELVSEYNNPTPFGPGQPDNNDIVYNKNLKTFLRVDLTEGGRVFRHNTVIVRGSIECTNPRFLNFSEDFGTTENPNTLWGTVDFEWIFTCHPLHSKTSTYPNYTEGFGRLATLNTSFLQIKNKSYGDSGPQALIEEGTLNLFTPINTGVTNAYGATFALQSETGASSDEINVVPKILKQWPGQDEVALQMTPMSYYNGGWSSDTYPLPDDNWDLNHVNFRWALPWLDDTSVNHGISPRFAIKGTYLLI